MFHFPVHIPERFENPNNDQRRFHFHSSTVGCNLFVLLPEVKNIKILRQILYFLTVILNVAKASELTKMHQ